MSTGPDLASVTIAVQDALEPGLDADDWRRERWAARRGITPALREALHQMLLARYRALGGPGAGPSAIDAMLNLEDAGQGLYRRNRREAKTLTVLDVAAFMLAAGGAVDQVEDTWRAWADVPNPRLAIAAGLTPAEAATRTGVGDPAALRALAGLRGQAWADLAASW